MMKRFWLTLLVVSVLCILCRAQAATVQQVPSLSALRALPTPSSPDAVLLQGFYASGDGGDGLFVWNSASSLTDSTGTVIRPDGLGSSSPGRWIRDCPAAVRNAAWFGCVVGSTPAQVRQAIQGAHDDLPNVQNNASFMTASGRHAKDGRLLIPSGDWYVDQKLWFSLFVTVDGGNYSTTAIHLQANVYTDSAKPVWFIEYESIAGSNFNEAFGGGLYNITILCGSNPGASGVYLVGAQNVGVDQLYVGEFSLQGMTFSGSYFGSVWINGNGYGTRGPGLSFIGGLMSLSVNCANVEHINYDLTTDSSGEIIPYILVESTSGLNILTAEGEGSASNVFIKIFGSINVSIGNVNLNGFYNGMSGTGRAVRITENSTSTSIAQMFTLGGGAGLVDDDARSGGDNRPAGYHNLIYTRNYHQTGYFTSLNVDALTLGNAPVFNDVPGTLSALNLLPSAKYTIPGDSSINGNVRQGDSAYIDVPISGYKVGDGQLNLEVIADARDPGPTLSWDHKRFMVGIYRQNPSYLNRTTKIEDVVTGDAATCSWAFTFPNSTTMRVTFTAAANAVEIANFMIIDRCP